ncbi:hypothetical protein [Flavobacterium columnare]|uniref:hypothetical protein n=1 Tax=Flavobacterium columnare TaxID=996 RepID=UPI0013D475E8|nr:hypothetical protein [Flavobacterium columnare]
MAKDTNEIQKIILDQKATASELSPLQVLTPDEQSLFDLNNTSKMSIWRLWVFVFASVMSIEEQLWDAFKIEIEKIIAASRVHTRLWYRDKALNYLHGLQLGETDVYDTTGLSDDDIKNRRIIANAAPVKMVINGYGVLRMKVVRMVGNELAPLTPEQLTAFSAYMNLVSDAGTTVIPSTGPADLLKLKMDVYYDALVLNPNGERLDGSDTEPVQNAIRNYLKSIKFNGSLILDSLTTELKKVQGVEIPVIKEAYSKFGTYSYDDLNVQNVGLINAIRVADAGYMKLDENNLFINFIPYTE